ncbi:MAG: polyphenol oxidase family protein [Treponema sp.]|nr:polyphenol oxidase family protein [Treponema sp.]
MNYFSIKDCTQNYAVFPFMKDGKPLENAPVCGLTLKKAGSMRFRWNETNTHRDNTLKAIAEKVSGGKNIQIAPVELIHSQIVYKAESEKDVHLLQGDGIISSQKNFMPVVTVADCMPLYIYDTKTGAYGIVHSGWKGTGIVANAIKQMESEYGTQVQDVCVILGPHIRNCCYIVNEERARYFTETFTKECVGQLEEGGKCYCGGRGLKIDWDNGQGQLYRLSLEKANLAVLEKIGVPSENITICQDCTCCNLVFGSNRRETAEGETFTVQAAWLVKQGC